MIKGGYMGKILRVDLTEQRFYEEDLPGEDVLRKYVGGVGLGSKIMLDEVPPSVKSQDPESRLIFMNGPLTGTMWPCSSRFAVIQIHGDIPKSMGTSWGGGFWAAKLKWSGYDGLILQGRSNKPVYLSIHNGKPELRDASHIWGKETRETEETLREELGDPQSSILCIGPAGERCLPGSILINDTCHASAKSGGGQVMGSKRLKAIAISGRGSGVPLADPKAFLDLALEYRRAITQGTGDKALTPRRYRRGGWPWKYPVFARQWRVAVKNYTDEEFQLPWAQEVADTVRVSKLIPRPCFNCPIGCAQDIIIGKGPYKGYRSRLAGGAEHMEGLAGMIGAHEGGTVLFLTDLCNRLGLESGLIGQNIALCCECYEKGLIDKKFTDGLEPKWGDAETAIAMVYKYINQEGIGKLFLKGPKGLAKAIGNGADQFLGGYKGTAMAHDHRSSWETILGRTVAGGGGAIEGLGVDCVAAEPDIGWPVRQPPYDRNRAPLAIRLTQIKNRWFNCIGVCEMSVQGIPGPLNYYTPKAVNLAVGWDMDRDEALLVGDRVVNTMRVFNLKRGLSIEDDLDVGPRFLDGFKAGELKGHAIRPYLRDMVKEYYDLMGWDKETGIPSDDVLKKLGLDSSIEDIAKLRHPVKTSDVGGDSV